ncbi:MAG: YgcG family protein [Gammaproteobacteria bacterium]|nr:MAG: YgcG family protein [Gammaproteobacteria bacterium]
MIKLKALLVALLFLCSAAALNTSAYADVPVPALTGHVIDQTSTLSPDQISRIEQVLSAFEGRKGSQLAVLIIATTEPESIEQYSIRVAEAWKLGRKRVDDGVILIIAKNDRALRIEVGYGLEGALTDVTSKRIIEEIITPYFKQGDFNAGITAGVQKIMSVIDGETLPPPEQKANELSEKGSQSLPVLVLVAIAISAVLRSIFGRFLGALATGGVVAFMVWIFMHVIGFAAIAGVLAFLFSFIDTNGRGGGWGGFGGGGRGGFGGGGGFSGGGGGFGGGGASGRW